MTSFIPNTSGVPFFPPFFPSFNGSPLMIGLVLIVPLLSATADLAPIQASPKPTADVAPIQAPLPPTADTKNDSGPRQLIHFGDTDPVALLIALAALIVSLVALWVTWLESQRNNSPIVVPIECGAFSMGGTKAAGGPELFCVLHNRGISLWRITVNITFRARSGTYSYEFKEVPYKETDEGFFSKSAPSADDSESPIEFARGMLAKFVLRPNKNDNVPGNREMFTKGFCQLQDPVKQKAELHVESQGRLAYSIPIGGFSERLKFRWNGIAHRINRRFEKWIEQPGIPCRRIVRTIYLPVFTVTLWDKIAVFIWSLQQQAQQPMPTLTPGPMFFGQPPMPGQQQPPGQPPTP